MSVAGKPRRQKAGIAPDPALLLAWYDRHRRVLPWRAARASRPIPTAVWLSEIMLQQTTVKAVAPYYARFLARWPTVAELAAAPLDDVLKLWAGLGYYARARNLHACARAVAEQHGGQFPDTEEALRALPGIGAYTAAAIAAIAFDRRASPVDGNIERVIARLFAVEEELPAAKPRIRALAEQLTPRAPRRRLRAGHDGSRRHDLHAEEAGLRALSVEEACAARARGDPETLSAQGGEEDRRAAARRGVRGGARRRIVLLRTRPAKGLLGGMTEVPTTEWTHDFDDATALAAAPLKATWRRFARRGHAHVHAFSARACRVMRRACRAHTRRRPACAGCRSPTCRRGAAERDAQGDRHALKNSPGLKKFPRHAAATILRATLPTSRGPRKAAAKHGETS